MNSESAQRILLVEDNPGDARLIAEILNRIGDIEMVTASTLSEALGYLREQRWDVVLLDLGLPDSEGIETLEKVQPVAQKACVVVLTGIESEEIGIQAIRQGAADYIVKGYVDARMLSASLRYAIERKNVTEALEESERNMGKAQSIAHVGSWEWDISRDTLYWSDELYRIFGLSPQEFASTYEAFINTIHPNDRKYVKQNIEEVFKTKKPFDSTHRIVRPDGSERVVEDQGEPTVAEDGTLVKIVGTVQDITERTKAEQALRKSKERYKLHFVSVSDIIFSVGANATITDISPSVEGILGYKPEDLEGKSFAELGIMTPESLERAIANTVRVFSGANLPVQVYEFITKEGNQIFGEITAKALVKDGQVISTFNVARDITERKRAEDALKESEDKFRTIFENVNDEIMYLDMDGRIIDVNDRVETISGWKREEVVGRHFSEFDFLDPASISGFTDSFTRAMQGEKTELVSIKAKRKDGTRVFIEASTSLIERDGVPQNLLITVRDVSDRIRVEEALKESEANWRSLTENSPDQIMTLDLDARIIFANHLVSSWTKKPTIGTSFYDHTLEEYKPVVRKCFNEVLSTGKTSEFESVSRDDKGDLHYLESYVGPVMRPGRVSGLTVRLADITQRKQSEKALLQANTELNFLNELAGTLAQCTTAKDVLDRALDMTLESLDLNVGMIYTLTDDHESLTLDAYSGISEQSARTCRTIDVGSNVKSGSKEATSTEDHLITLARDAIQSIGLPFCAISLLKSHNLPRGLICVATQEYREFPKKHYRLMETVGAEVGVAVEQTQLLEQLKELSRTDDLTGLDNRRRFYEVMDLEIDRATRYKGSFSLVLLDLDNLKYYNDRYGHTNGDAVLRNFARVLKSALRKSDMPFRYGGDEFIAILPSTSEKMAQRCIERVRSQWMNSARSPMNENPQLNFSTGVIQFPSDAETSDALIFLADTALYHSKRSGGGQDTMVSELVPSEQDALGIATSDQVYALAATVDAKDPYTYGHSTRVAHVAGMIGKAIGLSRMELENLNSAALLHDIGKVGIPDSILSKPKKLTDEEWLLVKKHSAEGANIVGYMKELRIITPFIRHHHEWFDGNGYPDGLSGDEIPIEARIISIADAYDTMTTDRTYRKAMSPDLALTELQRYGGTQFDLQLVEVFCEKMRESVQNSTGDGE
ncbi:MAG: PAS domain S-box protein [Chloroflexi bacterium]|nr:PAS domain S-box protein [Chloroflexota bacterium]